MRRGGRPWITDRRKALDLSQQNLADAIGVGRAQVSSWENGHSVPDGRNLLRAAEILGGTPEWLVSGVEGAHEVMWTPRAGAPVAERLFAFVVGRVGTERLAVELARRDLVTAAYMIARAERWPAGDFRVMDRWRDEILATD